MTAPRRPPGRYDEPRALPARRLLLAGAAVLAVVVLVGGYIVFVRSGIDQANAGVRSFRVLSDRSVEIVFDVRKRAASTTYCRVRARDAAGSEVGAETVPVGPAASGTTTVTHRLGTRGRANTGEVDGCAPAP